MKIPHFHHLFLAASLLAGSFLTQQSHGQPAPGKKNTPLVAEMKSPAQWEISISNKVQAKQSPASRWDQAVPIKVSYTLFGSTERIEQSWEDGATSVIYLVDGLTLIQYRNGVIEALTAFSGDMWSFPGLVGTAWITPNLKANKTSIQSRKVLVYEKEVPAQPSKDVTGAKWKATIDAKTKRPLKIQYNDYLIVYRYLPPPTAPLELPANFQKAMDDQLKRKLLLAHPPSELPAPPNHQ